MRFVITAFSMPRAPRRAEVDPPRGSVGGGQPHPRKADSLHPSVPRDLRHPLRRSGWWASPTAAATRGSRARSYRPLRRAPRSPELLVRTSAYRAQPPHSDIRRKSAVEPSLATLRPGVVASPFQGSDQWLGPWRYDHPNLSLLPFEADGGAEDPGHFEQLALDFALTGDAGHPLHTEGDDG